MRCVYKPGLRAPASVLIAAAVLCGLAAGTSTLHARVGFHSVAIPSRYSDAVDPGALQIYCADAIGNLQSFFFLRKLPFDSRLVREERGQLCHIYYEPSLPGFRASPDNAPVSGLFVDVDFAGFLSGRADRYGDVLDIAKAMLPGIERPLDITIGVPLNQDPALYKQALRSHLKDSIHRFGFRNINWQKTNPWTQDYLKSGAWQGQPRILVTRMSYEGNAENGLAYKPMLDSLTDERFHRSRLSWEGGDLQFVLHPTDPGKLILFYGHSARQYWGEALTGAEYEYVLKLEFGADLAVDLTDLGPHVDYFLCFLPADGIVLVSRQMRENFGILRAAVERLREVYQPQVPAGIVELDTLTRTREEAFGANLSKIRKLIDKLWKEEKNWSLSIAMETAKRIERYVQANCPNEPEQCVSPAGIAAMLAKEPETLSAWASGATQLRGADVATERLLNIVQSQLPGQKWAGFPGADNKIRRLENLGFKVVRVPHIGAYNANGEDWSGIGYVNAALIDRTLFVPEFGFGAAEKAIFDEIQAQLPDYRVAPVYARHMLLHNGGIHCILGFVRGAGPVPLVTNR
jgi:hypothetical protein